MKQTQKFAGFTLIELMIVVSIIGILASIAIPAFQGYIRKSKNSEAVGFMDAMFKGAASYYNQELMETASSGGDLLTAGFITGCAVPGTTPNLIPNVLVTPQGEKAGGDFSTQPNMVALGINESGAYWHGYMFDGNTKCRSAVSADFDAYQFIAMRQEGANQWFVANVAARAVGDSLIRAPGLNWSGPLSL